MRLMLGGLAAVLTLAACDATTPVPTVQIGLNRPAPGLERQFGWTTRPGAAAYTVVVSMDMSGATPVATSGFTATTNLPVTALAWREGHPIADRAYFWSVRAYDRPDPQGLLLAASEPREFRPAVWESTAWRLGGP